MTKEEFAKQLRELYAEFEQDVIRYGEKEGVRGYDDSDFRFERFIKWISYNLLK